MVGDLKLRSVVGRVVIEICIAAFGNPVVDWS